MPRSCYIPCSPGVSDFGIQVQRFVDAVEHRPTLELPHGESNRAYERIQVLEGFWIGIWTGASRELR